MSFNPYLFFSGNCAEAFAFYSEVFGVEAQVMRMGDVPPGEDTPPDVSPDTVMHASIEVGGSFLMGSDDPTGDGGPKSGFSVAYTAPSPAAVAPIFEALSEGGQVTMPPGPTFFSPAFGMLTDRFGVAWMVDSYPEDGAADS
ncbi:MAG: VOC family protein [Acidimicrobiales bacterium]|nr:VOC family protein [Acidimicrobiales bacterium]